jgi:uncharacterized repeat protein (TIGR01451 family)/CSLREA domain-containing protein
MVRTVVPHRRVRILVLVGVVVALMAGGAPLAQAGPISDHTYVVTSTLDQPDGDPAAGNCFDTPSGQCTLRAAIMVSNFEPGPNTINLPAGTYTLTRAGYDDTALVGDLDIGHDLTIQGAGSAATIVDGNGPLTGDRVFQVLSSAQNVTLSGLTIRDGRSLSSTVGAIGGGGLYLEGDAHLSLSDVIVQGNTSLNGGGLYANFSSLGGSLALDHVVVRANTAKAGGVGAGAGVFAYLPSSLSQMDLRDSQVYSNTADGSGGGFFVNGNSAIQWSIERSEIYSNTADSGGAIGTLVPLAVTDSRLHDNHAAFDGGAIEAFAPYTLTRSALEANGAGRFGGALFNLQQGPAASFATIVQSTLSGNAAQYGGAIYHDGFITPGSLLNLTNSTLSGNTVYRPVGKLGTADGGGLYLYSGTAELLNTTIADNHVLLSFSHTYTGIGGGVYITATAVLTADNTIIAKNIRGDGIHAPNADDCFANPGTTGTLAFDLIQDNSNCSVSGPQGGNIFSTDPLLGPLQDNGGSTQTQALLPGSPAINAGAATGCTDAAGSPLQVDQRNAARHDARCDIGAYEVVPQADLAVGQHDQPDPVGVGARLTYTVVVTNAGPVTATGLVLTDTLPAGTTFRAANTGTAVTCVLAGALVCDFSSLPLSSGGRLTVTVAVTTSAAGLITNTAAVSANEFDPDLATNRANETTRVELALYLPLVRRSP